MKKILLIFAGTWALLPTKAQSTVAHWKFTPEHTQGTIENGDLIIKDLSNHGNDLVFKVVERIDDAAVPVTSLTQEQKKRLKEEFQWVDDVYGNDNQKALLFNTGANSWDFGAYFETLPSAPLNTNSFENGYTIEVVFKMPKTFTREGHKWTSIFRKKGSALQYAQANKDFPYIFHGESELLAGLDVSNLKELQWAYYNQKPKGDNHYIDNQSSWSFSLADLDDWYHITLINDGKTTKIYINGVTDFRNADPNGNYDIASGMLPTIEGYGWLVGATGYYRVDADGDGIGEFPIKKLFDGTIQELRFTEGALPQNQWLYSDIQSTSHTQIGDNKERPLLTDEDNYNIVFVPDTQKPIRYMPEIVDTQMQWIANNHENNHIIFTNFLGDLVDRYNQKYEWDNILKSLDFLNKGNVRFMTVDGNHDGPDFAKKGGDPAVYIDYFGPEYYTGKDYYFNQSPSGYAAYSIVRGGNYTYLMISISYHLGLYLQDQQWVQDVMEEYSYLPIIFSTHEHLDFKEDGTGVFRYDDPWYQYYLNNGYTEEELMQYSKLTWHRMLKNHDNVFLAMSGHNHGAGYQISTNNFNHTVFEGVYDYQSDYHGGNGWMNFLEFDEDDNQINFRVFSPWVDQIPEDERTYYDVKNRTQPEEHFSYNINFKERFSFYPHLEKEEISGGNITIIYNNLMNVGNASIVVYQKGSAYAKENEVVKIKIQDGANNGKITLNIPKNGEYVAVVRKDGLYTPISNNLEFKIENLAVNELKEQKNVYLYPTPFNHIINVQSNFPIESVKIIDMNGAVVLNKSGQNDNEINVDTQAIPTGFYMIETLTSKGVEFEKAIKK